MAQLTASEAARRAREGRQELTELRKNRGKIKFDKGQLDTAAQFKALPEYLRQRFGTKKNKKTAAMAARAAGRAVKGAVGGGIAGTVGKKPRGNTIGKALTEAELKRKIKEQIGRK